METQETVSTIANACSLPSGDWGLVILTLDGNILRVLDTDSRETIGQLLYEIDLKRAVNLKAKAQFLRSRLSFAFEGEYFDFRSLTGARKFIKAVREAMS